MLRNTRCLVGGLDEDGRVAELNCPWGDCEVDALRVGEPLPESLVAVLAAVPPERAEQHFPFIYLDETTVVD
ncbi:MAG: hypothetical protein KJN94_07545, partial [Gammaproteobacteria bacterium]|nr:hypothetical protein [Gammaproteobacteria bacterium]